MSNDRAVATVSAALCRLLSRELPADLRQAQVNPQKPPTEPPAEPTVTVFCYQVTVNGALRNRDAPTRAGNGTLLQRPEVGLDLHYLISFYGDEARLEQQRLLGAAVRALHEQPVLTDADIAAAADLPYLLGTDLAGARDRVRFTPTHLDIDDLYKLWTMMSGTPYALSLCYLASVVAIDGQGVPAAGPPVAARTVQALPGRPPIIQRIRSRPAAVPGGSPVDGPVPADHVLVVDGSGLAGEATVWARVGDEDVALPAAGVRGDRLLVELPGTLPPGPHSLRILHDVPTAERTLPKARESNAVPFVRQPRITAVHRPGPGALEVSLDLPVRARQRVQVLLDELAPAPGAAGRSYQLDGPFPVPDRPDPRIVSVGTAGVAAATYLVRVAIDGARSPLERAGAGEFTGPTIELT